MFKEYMDEFIDYMEVRQKSESTITNYTIALKQFKRFLNKPLLKATPQDVDSFVYFKRNQGCKNTTINLKINAIRRFYKVMERNRGLNRDTRKILSYEALSIKKITRDVLDEDEVISLIDECECLRMKALIALLFQTGIRISEAAALKKHNFWEKDDFVMVHIKNSKRGKSRKVFMNYFYYKYIQDYLKKRKGKSKYIFISEENRNPEYSFQKLTKEFLGRELRRVTTEILGRKVNPHDFRASCLTYLHRKGVDLYTIAKIAGHDNIQVTKDYIYSEDEEIGRRAMQAFIDN